MLPIRASCFAVLAVPAALAVPAVSGASTGFAINAAIDSSACSVAPGLLFPCCLWAVVQGGIMCFFWRCCLWAVCALLASIDSALLCSAVLHSAPLRCAVLHSAVRSALLCCALLCCFALLRSALLRSAPLCSAPSALLRSAHTPLCSALCALLCYPRARLYIPILKKAHCGSIYIATKNDPCCHIYA